MECEKWENVKLIWKQNYKKILIKQSLYPAIDSELLCVVIIKRFGMFIFLNN